MSSSWPVENFTEPSDVFRWPTSLLKVVEPDRLLRCRIRHEHRRHCLANGRVFASPASGDRAEAIRQYHVCAQLLANELGIEPSGETKSLLEDIRARGDSSRPWPVNRATPSSASSAPALSDRPSIAVLPFDNLTDDPEQEYFADGMTEDITTGLSRFPSLFVISRNSSFSYKGRSPDVRDVARDLGVRYVLDGSVRKSGEQIRITAQLVEANSGKQIWAERYDRRLGDIFSLQDEITAAIIAAIAPEIDEAERMLARRRPPENLDVWSRYQLGLTAAYMTTKEALESAVVQLDEVNALDPNFAPAFAYGVVARLRLMRHFTGFDDELVEQAHDKARSGIAVDPRNPDCLMSLCRVYLELAQYELAIAKAEEALSLNPNSAAANFLLGYSLSRSGRPEDAITYLDRAILLSPRDIDIGGFCGVKGVALFHLGRYQESAHWGQRSISSPNPRPIAFLYLMGALMKLERTKEAAAMIPTLMRAKPELTLSEMREKIVHDYGRLGEAVEILFAALCDLALPK